VDPAQFTEPNNAPTAAPQFRHRVQGPPEERLLAFSITGPTLVQDVKLAAGAVRGANARPSGVMIGEGTPEGRDCDGRSWRLTLLIVWRVGDISPARAPGTTRRLRMDTADIERLIDELTQAEVGQP